MGTSLGDYGFLVSFYFKPDAVQRKCGSKQIRYPVVHTLNDESLVLVIINIIRATANALNSPPGDYGRKTETQRN